MTRYLSPGHERQALGSSSPGPARYRGHDEALPVVPQSYAPPASCSRKKKSRVSPRERTAAAYYVEAQREGSQRDTSAMISPRPRYIGEAELNAADKHVRKAKAGSTGVHIIRLPISPAGERENACGFFTTRKEEVSPGPAQYFPNVSCISPRGCPVFATPNVLESAGGEKMEAAQTTHSISRGRWQSKGSHVHRRWPTYTHYKDGNVCGILGQDSPGPAVVNLASHDPFRPKYFLKTGVCWPPPITRSSASRSFERTLFL